MTVIIIDDEIQSHKVLSSLLMDNHPDLQILASAYNVQEGVKLINQHQPNLVFLDIEMPDGSGFDLLKKIGTPNFNVIFITAFNHYARSAIKFGALDYLLKPVSLDELNQALSRARAKEKERISDTQLKILFETLHNLQERKLPSRICISTSEGILYTLLKNIVRLEAQQNYTSFTLISDTKNILASVNIGEYVEQFEPYEQFMQVHRSHLINLEFVDKFVKADGGYLVMKDGASVSVSRPNREKLMERLKQL